MRKWIAIAAIVVVLFSLVYWMIPPKTEIHQKAIIAVNTKAFTREILNEQEWQWWPGAKPKNGQAPLNFGYNGNTYSIIEKKLSSFVITISKEKDSIHSELFFLPIQNDSIQLNWIGLPQKPAGILSRMEKKSWIKHVDADMQLILEKMSSFYSNEDNVYGSHMQNSTVADSNYIFTSFASRTYPSIKLIYNYIDQLQHYIQLNNARSLGPPMLNIYVGSDSTYFTKVAFPVDKKLNDAGNIQYRWMLKGGNILVTEVRGGPHKIDRAFLQMQNYLQDHLRTSPAIPFQSLITDRRQEPDTNKWITRLYWPMM